MWKNGASPTREYGGKLECDGERPGSAQLLAEHNTTYVGCAPALELQETAR
jgi:hypothetical protein